MAHSSSSSSSSRRLNADAPEFKPTRPDPAVRQPPPPPPRYLMVPSPSPRPPMMYVPPPPPPPPGAPFYMPVHYPYGPQQYYAASGGAARPVGAAGFGVPTPPEADQPSGSGSGTGNAAASAAEEAENKVRNQVEYYFSDINLATTDHLMRFIKKDPEGYVPLSVVASFKKIKALINSSSQLASILRKSSKLVVSEDGKKVRRLHSLTAADIEELQSRIVVAENLPEDHCHQNLMKVFSAVGSVKSIRTCPPQTSNGGGVSTSRSTRADNMPLSNKLHAFVEYESAELAEKAVAELNDEGNWRSGLRVKLMHRQLASYIMPAFDTILLRLNDILGSIDAALRKQHSKAGQSRGRKMHDGEILSEEDVSTSEQHTNEKQIEDISQHLDAVSHEHPGEENVAEKEVRHRKRGGHGRGKGRVRAQAHDNHGNHVGTPPNNYIDNDLSSIAKQPPGPRMPDGTRGFSMGRGKPVADDIS